MVKKVNLIDYEKIVNEKGQRMIFFRRYAGIAGIINSFWALRQRWSRESYPVTFFEIATNTTSTIRWMKQKT